MLGLAINLELGEKSAAETVLRKHPAYGSLDKTLGTGLKKLARTRGPDAARIVGMVVIQLVPTLGASQFHLGRVDHDHKVACILMRGIVGTMLTAQDAGRARCYSAQGTAFSIDQDPSPTAQCVFMRDAFGLF